jgi:hypothetical protein
MAISCPFGLAQRFSDLLLGIRNLEFAGNEFG